MDLKQLQDLVLIFLELKVKAAATREAQITINNKVIATTCATSVPTLTYKHE